MKALDEFLEKLDSGGTYMMWSFPVGDTGKKVFKEEIIKDPYRVKAAQIIREMKLCIDFYKNLNFFGSKDGAIHLNDKEPANITLFAIEQILKREK